MDKCAVGAFEKLIKKQTAGGGEGPHLALAREKRQLWQEKRRAGAANTSGGAFGLTARQAASIQESCGNSHGYTELHL